MFSKQTKNGIPLLPDATCLAASLLSQQQASNKKRKVVRFEEEEGEDKNERPVKRRIVELHDVPTSSDMTLEEKNQKWRQKSHHIATILAIQKVARDCQSSFDNNSSDKLEDDYMHYAESIITTFNLCYAESSITETAELEEGGGEQDCDDDADIDKANARLGLPLDQMILFGDHHTPARGLENTIMRGLAAQRLLAKKEHVENVLYVQDHLRAMDTNNMDVAVGIGAFSRCLSAPSKRFARAMGVVDGTLALLEYASSSDSSTNENNNAADNEGLQRNLPQQPAVTDFAPPSSCDKLVPGSAINNALPVSVA